MVSQLYINPKGKFCNFPVAGYCSCH